MSENGLYITVSVCVCVQVQRAALHHRHVSGSLHVREILLAKSHGPGQQSSGRGLSVGEFVFVILTPPTLLDHEILCSTHSGVLFRYMFFAKPGLNQSQIHFCSACSFPAPT